MTDSGGRLGIFDMDTPGLNNSPQLEIVNVGSPIVFQWDPFHDKHTLAVGGDCSLVGSEKNVFGIFSCVLVQ